MGDYCPAISGGTNAFLDVTCTTPGKFCLTTTVSALETTGNGGLPPCSTTQVPCNIDSDTCCPFRPGGPGWPSGSSGLCDGTEPFATSAATGPPTYTLPLDCQPLLTQYDDASFYKCNYPYKALYYSTHNTCYNARSGPGNVLYCATTNPQACPNLSGGVKETYYKDDGKTNAQQTHTQVCVYDNSALLQDKTGQALQQVLTVIQDEGNAYDASTVTNLYRDFCSQTDTRCPAGLGGKCSMFLSSGSGGDICRKWFQADPANASATMTTYCAANSVPECQCIDPLQDSTYQFLEKAFTSGYGSNQGPVCWYAPCKSGTTEVLMTQDLINQQANCKSANEICNDVLNIWQSSQIDIGKINTATGCNLNPTPGPNPPGPTPDPTHNWAYYWRNYKWWIIGAIVGFVLLIFVIVLAAATSRKHSATKVTPMKTPSTTLKQ